MDKTVEDLQKDEILQEQINQELDAGIVLAERTFVRARTVTFEHFNYRVNAVKAAGVVPIIQKYKQGTDVDIMSATLITQAMQTGQLFTMLSGLLVEDKVPWSIAEATRNAKFFANLSDPEDLAKLCEMFLWLLLDFFLNGVASNRIFQKFLWQPLQPQKSQSNGATPTSESSLMSSLQ